MYWSERRVRTCLFSAVTLLGGGLSCASFFWPEVVFRFYDPTHPTMTPTQVVVGVVFDLVALLAAVAVYVSVNEPDENERNLV